MTDLILERWNRETTNDSLESSALNGSLLPLVSFLAEDNNNYDKALKDLVGEPRSESFRDVLDLMKLCVNEDYHRSARDILRTAVSSEHQICDASLLSSLATIADKILERTFKIGAWEINDSMRELLANWPSVADSLPKTREEVAERYSPPLNMGAGEIVNRLRINPSPDVIDEARDSFRQVVRDLFYQRVYGWVVDFLAQSDKYGIMSVELRNEVVRDLDRELTSSDSLICRWYLEKVLSAQRDHNNSLDGTQLPRRPSE